jgi:outer membrane protein assembly factor BamB
VSLKISEKWRYKLPRVREAGGRCPCFSGNSLLHVFHYRKAGFYESSIICFDFETGKENWRFVESHLLNSPYVDENGNIYFSSYAGSVICLESCGTIKWRSELNRSNVADVMLIDGGRLVVSEVGGGSQFLYCLDNQTGDVIWKFDGGGHSYRLACDGRNLIYPCAQKGTDFERNYGVRLYSINPETGIERWHVQSADWMFSSVIDNGILWVGARGSVRAIDLENGVQIDQYDLEPDQGVFNIVNSAVGAIFFAENSNELVCISLETKRHFFKKTSKISYRWSLVIEGESISNIVLKDHRIICGTSSGDIVIVDLMTGSIIDRIKISKSSAHVLALESEFLAVASKSEIILYERQERSL